MPEQRRLSRDELIELVRKIAASDGDEETTDVWIDLLDRNVPHPAAAGLIFHSDPELTPEEIVDAALAYRPILL